MFQNTVLFFRIAKSCRNTILATRLFKTRVCSHFEHYDVNIPETIFITVLKYVYTSPLEAVYGITNKNYFYSALHVFHPVVMLSSFVAQWQASTSLSKSF